MALRRIYSLTLLFVLGITLIPVESFHHHEEESIVCNKLGAHLEEPLFECEFADFVLPVYEQDRFFIFNVFHTDQSLTTVDRADVLVQELFLLPKYRGPPIFTV